MKENYMGKVCSILAPKVITFTDGLENKIIKCIKKLIIEDKVTTFLFEPRSNFGIICLKIISQFKKDYPNIQRICYTSKNEHCIIESEYNDNFNTIAYDQEIHYENKYFTRKFSNIERDWKMIDASDICLFYYDKNESYPIFHPFKPITVKHSNSVNIKHDYEYASGKNKTIINLYDLK